MEPRFREPGIRFCFAFVTPFVNTFGLNCAGAVIVRLKWVTNYLNDVKRGCLLTRLGGE